MTRDDPPVRVRLSQDLKDRIQAAAKHNRRSMNAEINARLEESFGIAPQDTASPLSPSVKSWIKAAKRGAEGASPDERLLALEVEVQELRSGLLELRQARQGGPEMT
ncbi:Arc family DNA-binding protein [Loktanella salsilacus]|uniref:Arc family DNA-binding protein n=1 Tax=Loktanella salsilacus TaxID=195913 RepID=UPI000B7E7A85|nr:Arc family DNA-binding protein [Loktanella salsilacus]